MRSRKTLILLAALVLLAGAAVLTEGPWLKRRKRGGESPVVFTGRPEEVSLIEISSSVKLVLRKENDAWQAGSDGNFYPADAEAVKRVLDALGDLNAGVLVSRNPANHASYQVDDTGGLKVAVFAGEKKDSEFILGGQGPDYFSSYIRQAGRDEVLLVKGYLRPFFGRPLKYWRDMTIFAFPAKEAVELEVVQPKERLVLRKEDEKWRIVSPAPAEADQGAVDDLLSRLIALKAADVAEGKVDDPGFAQPAMRLSVTLKDQTGREAVIGRLEEGQDRYYARSGNREGVYLIGSYVLGDIKSILARIPKK